jgi:hypothetical protein
MKPFQNHSDNTRATYQQSTNSETPKNSHIGHCIHAVETANVKVQNIFHGRNITLHVAQTVNKEQLQHRTVVCCRYIIVNTLHRGDNKDDDDDDDDNNVLAQFATHAQELI